MFGAVSAYPKQIRDTLGGLQMTYSDFLDDLAQQIDSLALRSKAAVFWLLGSGLLTALEQPANWVDWFARGRDVGYRFVTTGEVSSGTDALWAQAGTPTGDDATQLLNSAIICLSTPLGLAINPNLVVGAWAEHAFFPLIQSVSQELFDDIAFPGGDEDLDRVFATPQVQTAAEFVLGLVARMAAISEPDASVLDGLLVGARVLTSSTSD
jgi:hypothetical protein